MAVQLHLGKCDKHIAFDPGKFVSVYISHARGTPSQTGMFCNRTDYSVFLSQLKKYIHHNMSIINLENTRWEIHLIHHLVSLLTLYVHI